MPAFGASPLTPTRTHDPSRDGTTPQCRSLALGGMCSPGALPGTSGTHTEVITGDWQQKVTGSATVHIDGDSDTTVQGSSDTTVQGDVMQQFNQNCIKTVTSTDTLKVHGDSIMVVNGSETNTTLGPTLETRVGEHTQVHQAQENNQDKSEFNQHGLFVGDLFKLRLEITGFLFNFFAAHADTVGTRIAAGLFMREYSLIKDEARALKKEMKGLTQKLELASNNIGGLQDEITALTNQVHPIKMRASGLAVVETPILITPTVPDALIAEFALTAAL